MQRRERQRFWCCSFRALTDSSSRSIRKRGSIALSTFSAQRLEEQQRSRGAKGVWRDDDRANELVFDEPVIINCYTSDKLIEEQADELRTFLLEMGTETQQGAVGLVIDRDYLEIAFPLESQANG